MKELLAEFCRLAPKEWGAYEADGGVELLNVNAKGVDGRGDSLYVEIVLEYGRFDDRASAEALVFLWDWLDEKLEYPVRWGEPPRMKDGLKVYSLEVEKSTDGFVFKSVGYVGQTRIESVLRACVAVFKEVNE